MEHTPWRTGNGALRRARTGKLILSLAAAFALCLGPASIASATDGAEQVEGSDSSSTIQEASAAPEPENAEPPSPAPAPPPAAPPPVQPVPAPPLPDPPAPDPAPAPATAPSAEDTTAADMSAPTGTDEALEKSSDDQSVMTADDERQEEERDTEDKPGNDNPGNKITICHATGSQSNPFVQISPNANGVISGHVDHQHERDIIPPFTYKEQGKMKQFPGQNWDAAGIAIYDNNCEEKPDPQPKTPTVTATASDCIVMTTQDKVKVVITLGNLTPGHTYTVTVISGDTEVQAENLTAALPEAMTSFKTNVPGKYTVTVAGKKGNTAETTVLVDACERPDDDVTFCHATGPAETDPFIMMTLPAQIVLNEHVGNEHQNGRDIIPPFEFTPVMVTIATSAMSADQFAGHNWNEKGQALLEKDCVSEIPPPEPEKPEPSDQVIVPRADTPAPVAPVKAPMAKAPTLETAAELAVTGAQDKGTLLPLAALMVLSGACLLGRQMKTGRS